MNVVQILYYIMMYLSCIFEVYLLYDLMIGGFEIYEERRFVQFLYLIVSSIVIFAINNLNLPTANLLCVPIVFFLFTWLVFRIDLKYNLVYVLFYTVILDVSEFAFYYIILLSNDNEKAVLNEIFFTIVKLIVMFAIVQVVKRQHQKIHEKDNYKYSKSLFILPAASLVLLNGFVMAEEQPTGYFLTCIGGILLVISNVVEFYTMEKLLKAEGMAKDTELLAMKAKLELSHYQRVEEINRNYAEYLHEMRRIVRTVDQLTHIEAGSIAEGLVEKILHIEKPSGDQYIFNNPIVNAIFLEREKQALEKDMIYHVDIQPGIDLSFIDDLDIISILGNLLDNALEAAEGCLGAYVTVRLYKGNNELVIIRVENNFKASLKKNGKNYLTIKPEKEKHGFGIKKIEEISQTYGGILSCSVEKNIFTAVLILSEQPNSAK